MSHSKSRIRRINIVRLIEFGVLVDTSTPRTIKSVALRKCLDN
jgi:hypothetical protein